MNVVVIDKDGADISGEKLLGYTAVKFSILKSGGYLEKVPSAATGLSGDKYHNNLWLLVKSTSAGGTTDDSRTLAVFRLISVNDLGNATVELTYEQIF